MPRLSKNTSTTHGARPVWDSPSRRPKQVSVRRSSGKRKSSLQTAYVPSNVR